MLIISSRIAIDAVTKSFFVATQEILVNAQKKTNQVLWKTHTLEVNKHVPRMFAIFPSLLLVYLTLVSSY
jgi:hypothetical protein